MACTAAKKSIIVCEFGDNHFGQNGRVYGGGGLAPTITAHFAKNVIEGLVYVGEVRIEDNRTGIDG